jgi:AraC-like DNA-binding protein
MRQTISQGRNGDETMRSVPIGTLVLIREALHELGVDGDALLRSMGVAPGLLEHPLTPVPVAIIGKIIAQAIRQSGCPYFAVFMGARARLDNAGVLPMLLTSETCVGDAIADLIRFLRIWYQGMHFGVHVDCEWARLSVSVSSAFEGHTDLCTSYTASMLRHLETCIGPDWRASRICLARRRPPDVSPYLRILRAPVCFDQAENLIEFSAAVLDRRREDTDARLRTYLRDQLVQLESVADTNLIDRVQRLIKVLLVEEACTVERVAALLSMHRKTLHRFLRAEGTTFEVELDRTRRNLAEQMLNGSVVSVSEIARVLGYTSSANFTRAFHRWHDMPPTAWRRDRAAITVPLSRTQNRR